MVRSERILAAGVGVVAVSLIVLNGCSNTHTPKPVMPQDKQLAIRQKAEQKKKQIAQLNSEKKNELKKSEAARKKLPIILAESDSAFKIANESKKRAAREKSASKKNAFEVRAEKAQQIADQKALDLTSMHKSIYDSANRVRELDAKIASLKSEKM